MRTQIQAIVLGVAFYLEISPLAFTQAQTANNTQNSALNSSLADAKTGTTFQLSPSFSLLVKRATTDVKPTGTPLPGLVPIDSSNPLGRLINEVYVIVLKSGSKEVELERSESVQPFMNGNSAALRFGLFAASLDRNTLRYLFYRDGKALLSTAHVTDAGEVSEHRQRPLSKEFPALESATFVRDTNGDVILRLREAGQGTKAYRFNEYGAAESVSDDKIRSLPVR